MKDFEKFVRYMVNNWDFNKEKILKKLKKNNLLEGELGELSNREKGDEAENYILEKIQNMGYDAYKTQGSRSPADIIAVKKIKDYWHIMLIQVKSSIDKNNIYILNKDDKRILQAFRLMFKPAISKNDSILKNYQKSKIIISTGCAYVWRVQTGQQARHYLIEAKYLDRSFMNIDDLDSSIMEKIKENHTLQP